MASRVGAGLVVASCITRHQECKRRGNPTARRFTLTRELAQWSIRTQPVVLRPLNGLGLGLRAFAKMAGRPISKQPGRMEARW